jgi:germination protein M
MRAWFPVAGLLALVLLLPGCGRGQVVDVGAAPTRPAHDATSTAAPPDGSAPTEQAADGGADGGMADSGGGDGAGSPGGPADPEDPGDPTGGGSPGTSTTTLSVWFTQGEQVAAVPRSVPRVPRIGSAVLEQLLAGPTADEQAAGYGTEIPSTTRLRDLTITDGVAVADFSGDFESGGGTLGLTLRLAQVVCTLDQFPTVDGVRFALDGEVVDVFSGDGLIIDEPVACSDYAENVAG